MANLENNSNLYADLAQGAYTGRPIQFPYDSDKWNNGQLESKKNDSSVKFDFPRAQDASGNKVDTVYLQPDNTVKTVTEKNFFGRENSYDKGLLTDEKAGYNSYYLTDTPTLNKDTKRTYFTTRGSDAVSTDIKKGWAGNNLNDWVNNNADFAVNNAYIPQAKLATEAMHQKIKEMLDFLWNIIIQHCIQEF